MNGETPDILTIENQSETMIETKKVTMKLHNIVTLLNAKAMSNNYNAEKLIEKGLSSDLMSDVLTVDTKNMVLLTGLSNLQTIRTAEMAEVDVVVVVRNKSVSEEMIALAEENDIVLLSCGYSLFKATGILFNAGLEPVY